MRNNKRTNMIPMILTFALFCLFLIFTMLVIKVDVAKIGPEGTSVGLSSMNGAVHDVLGYNELWYKISSVIGAVILMFAAGFAAFGAIQFISRKSILKVDSRILLLGIFYAVVAVCYAVFSKLPINYRPVILESEGGLETSYPSSHTMFAVTVMSTSIMQFIHYLKNKKLLKKISVSVCAVLGCALIITRTLSGVHWLSDIIASIIFSAALVMLYYLSLKLLEKNAE